MREHAQAAYEPRGKGSLTLLPYCVNCPDEWGWPCDVALERTRTLDAVLKGLRSEDDSTQLRAIIREVEAMRGE